jgi:hypothetical protein
MVLARSFLTALIGSLIVNLVLLFVLRPLVIDPSMPLNALSIGPVASFTIMGVAGATIVYALLRRLMVDPNPVFLWIALVVLLFSFIPDVTVIGKTEGMFAGGSVATASVLALMHVATAAIVVLALTRLWGRRAAGSSAFDA